jgi:FkbM family methyltransferase
MQVIHFDFNGPRTLVTNDHFLSQQCAKDIIAGGSYPLPTWDYHPKVVVDLGGHAGEFSVMAKLRWPLAEVHCYEPNPEILPYCRENAAKYGFIIHPVAVDVKSRKAMLHVSHYGTVADSLLERPKQTGHSVEVQTESASRIAIELKPDVLKLDIEGLEVPVLTMFDVSRIGLIYLEFHSAEDRWLIDDFLRPTHDVWHAKIGHAEQGEMMYIKKHTVPRISGK